MPLGGWGWGRNKPKVAGTAPAPAAAGQRASSGSRPQRAAPTPHAPKGGGRSASAPHGAAAGAPGRPQRGAEAPSLSPRREGFGGAAEVSAPQQSPEDVVRKVAQVRDDFLGPLREMISATPSMDMSPTVDLFLDEACKGIQQLQDRATTDVVMASERYDLIEQISNLREEFEDVSGRVEEWQRHARDGTVPASTSPAPPTTDHPWSLPDRSDRSDRSVRSPGEAAPRRLADESDESSSDEGLQTEDSAERQRHTDDEEEVSRRHAAERAAEQAAEEDRRREQEFEQEARQRAEEEANRFEEEEEAKRRAEEEVRRQKEEEEKEASRRAETEARQRAQFEELRARREAETERLAAQEEEEAKQRAAAEQLSNADAEAREQRLEEEAQLRREAEHRRFEEQAAARRLEIEREAEDAQRQPIAVRKVSGSTQSSLAGDEPARFVTDIGHHSPFKERDLHDSRGMEEAPRQVPAPPKERTSLGSSGRGSSGRGAVDHSFGSGGRLAEESSASEAVSLNESSSRKRAPDREGKKQSRQTSQDSHRHAAEEQDEAKWRDAVSSGWHGPDSAEWNPFDSLKSKEASSSKDASRRKKTEEPRGPRGASQERASGEEEPAKEQHSFDVLQRMTRWQSKQAEDLPHKQESRESLPPEPPKASEEEDGQAMSLADSWNPRRKAEDLARSSMQKLKAKKRTKGEEKHKADREAKDQSKRLKDGWPQQWPTDDGQGPDWCNWDIPAGSGQLSAPPPPPPPPPTDTLTYGTVPHITRSSAPPSGTVLGGMPPSGTVLGGPAPWPAPADPGHRQQHKSKTATLHIRRPFSEIAHDVDGFANQFARAAAQAAGVPIHRIRVKSVRCGD